jgi:RNA polymerase sigma-54 factor
MFLGLQQKQQLTQKLIMTPQLQLAVKLLQLSRLELTETIRQELEENPALEEAGEPVFENGPLTHDENDRIEPASTENSTIEDKLIEAIDRQSRHDSFDYHRSPISESEKKEYPSFENTTAARETLTEHLLWQLMMTSPTPEQEMIGSMIAGNLDRNGYLTATPEEIAAMCESALQKIEEVLALMQTFDPPGVCAGDLRECLLIQLRQLGIEDASVTEIVANHLHHIEWGNFRAIKRATRFRIEEIFSAVEIIKSFEPRPGRPFGEQRTEYIVPDIFVTKTGRGFTISLNHDELPYLRVSSFCMQALRNKRELSRREMSYLRDKIRAAAWLISSIQQRQNTILRVMESILKFQHDFFEHGVSHLQPLVLRDVAEDIDMSEGTVSRTTSNKYVHTPRGIFSLKFFFTGAIKRFHGDPLSAISVQEKIRNMIASEDPRKPYSDDRIANMLNAAGIDIARRTVAKYREKMKIPASNRRKRL